MAQVHPFVRTLFRTASVLAFVAVVMGSVVCATDSGFECGNWPGCTDRTLLPGAGDVTALFYKNPWIEMVHRTSAILAGPAALACAIVALHLRGVHPLVKVLPWVSVAGALVAGVVGRGIVLGAVYPTWVGAADLFSALACLGGLIVATVALERGSLRFAPTRAGRYAWVSVAALVGAHLVALWAAGAGSYTRCMSWPVWTLVPGDDATLTLVRSVLYVLAITAIGAAARSSWHRSPRLAAALVGLTIGLIVLGLIIGYGHVRILGFAYSTLTVTLLALLVLVAARESLQRLHPRVESASRPRDEARATTAG